MLIDPKPRHNRCQSGMSSLRAKGCLSTLLLNMLPGGETQREKSWEGWGTALRVEGTKQCCGHRLQHPQTMGFREVLLPERKHRSAGGRTADAGAVLEGKFSFSKRGQYSEKRDVGALRTCLQGYIPWQGLLFTGKGINSMMLVENSDGLWRTQR